MRWAATILLLARTFTGTDFADSISGQDGNDALYGGGGADRLFGNLGIDLLAGGAGDDALAGGRRMWSSVGWFSRPSGQLSTPFRSVSTSPWEARSASQSANSRANGSAGALSA